MAAAPRCNFFWGSHGCDKEMGHELSGDFFHRCGGTDELAKFEDDSGPCCVVNANTSKIRYFVWDDDNCGRWSDLSYDIEGWRMAGRK